ncbi:MAG: iron-sulfur cluster assembly scaffold protein [Spirochaetes bacterium]|nr:iron-sulfur cluster assembly scaffold protein [Spirochaetota bacterium]MBN2770712.1 iron-sulfur cluster assembly scaffold protein [Spirochaetota bacterium]
MDKNQWAYSENVKKHFMNPQNILQIEEDKYPADGKGMVGSPACGDMMMVLIKVANNRISDFKWKTFGCASAIASTSALSELVLKDGGMTLEEAYKVTPEDIIRELGGLPSNKIHCSVLGDKALREAIDDYYNKNNQKNPSQESVSRVVCDCKNVTEEDIRMEVLEGVTDFEKMKEVTGASTVCGKCEQDVRDTMKKFVEQYYKDDIYNPGE